MQLSVVLYVAERSVSVSSQVILQPGSSVASKEIRIDTRSAPGREGATPVLVTMLCGQPWPPQCQAYLGCFLCSTVLSAMTISPMSVPTTENLRRGEKCQWLNISAQFCYHQLFAPCTRVTKHICTDLHFLLKCLDVGNVVTAQNPSPRHLITAPDPSPAATNYSFHSELRPKQRHSTAHQNLMQFTEPHPSDDFKLHRYTKRWMLIPQCVMMMLSNSNLSSA